MEVATRPTACMDEAVPSGLLSEYRSHYNAVQQVTKVEGKVSRRRGATGKAGPGEKKKLTWASAGGCCQRQSEGLTCAAGLLLEQLLGQLLLLLKVQVCRGVHVGHPLWRGGRRRRHHCFLRAWLRKFLRLWSAQPERFTTHPGLALCTYIYMPFLSILFLMGLVTNSCMVIGWIQVVDVGSK